MTSDEVINSYWKYYLSLESQVVELERFIEFDLKVNGKTYSSRLLELLQAICSEIDVIGKTLALQCDSSYRVTKYTPIKSWWFVIQNTYAGIQSEPVCFRKETLFPWANFFVAKVNGKHIDDPTVLNAHVPAWWNSYNNVKHRRTDRDRNGLMYSHANLSNVINALAGLCVLETLLLEKTGCVVDSNDLFSIEGHNVFRNYMTWGAV